MKFVVAFIFSICILSYSSAQVMLEPVLYSNMGGSSTFGSYEMDFSAGEPVINTATANGVTFTQGFHQPILRFVISAESLNATYASENTCRGKETGTIMLNVVGGLAPYYVFWNDLPDDSTTFFRENLPAGEYGVVVKDLYQHADTISIIISETDDCLKPYTGISPNGDGKNDSWVIMNINSFPDNKVQIYSRWGNMVWETKGYNNENNFWDGKDLRDNKLPDGTYFFVIENTGPKPSKGWVELTTDFR